VIRHVYCDVVGLTKQ